MRANPVRSRSMRRGVTLVESAVVLSICLFLLLGMLELSVALVRHTVLAEAARRVVRSAIVHGAKARLAQGRWGPASLTMNAAGAHPAAAIARDTLMTIDPSQVQIAIEWLDASNQPDQRVRVAVSYTHHPVVPVPGWYDRLNLQSVSTMRIAH